MDYLIGIVICIILSGYFSACETVLMSLPALKARQILESNTRYSHVMAFWIKNPNRILTTILVGNNIVNTSASVFAGELAHQSGKHVTTSVVIGVITFLILVFGEITPKIFGRINSEKMAIPFLHIIRIVYFVLFPISFVFLAISKSVISVTGTSITRKGPFITQDDIEYFISVAKMEGTIEKDKMQILTSIFEFSDTRVREIMVSRKNVVAIDVNSNYETIIQTVISSAHSRIPVYFGHLDNIVGVLHSKDMLSSLKTGGTFDLKRILRKPYFVNEMKRINKVFEDMKMKKIHLAIVKDASDVVVGIVTLEDILEEIVGEINDEYDIEEGGMVIKRSDTDITVNAEIQLKDLQSNWNIEIESSDNYHTLGGFLMYQTGGEIPPPGSHIIWKGYNFKIIKASDSTVHLIEITRVTHANDMS